MILLTVLTVLTLLASGGAGADADAEPPPVIAARTPSTLSYRGDHSIKLDPAYGEDITIICTGRNWTNLALVGQLGQLQAEELNSTTIQVSIKKPDVGKHTYYCTDRRTGYNQTLNVTVYPAVTVTAPNVHHTIRVRSQEKLETLFFVPHGENYDMFCSANDVETLKILLRNVDDEDYVDKTYSEVVNATTVTGSIKFVDIRRDDNDNDYDYEKHYACEKNGKDGIIYAFKVIMDYSPEAGDFQCVLYLSHKLECTWSSMTKMNDMTIFSEGKLLCSAWARSITGNSCEGAWNDELENAYISREVLHIDLQTCNEVYCNNQTFSIDIKPITKIEPVYNLQLTHTEFGTIVDWQHRKLLCAKGCEYKVEYRQMGMQWRQADLSSLACNDSDDMRCKLNLSLPCPAHYEVNVYMRPLIASKDGFWSESTSVVYVKARNAGDDVLCAELREQAHPPTEVVLHQVRELISQLNNTVTQKLVEIKALMDSQT